MPEVRHSYPAWYWWLCQEKDKPSNGRSGKLQLKIILKISDRRFSVRYLLFSYKKRISEVSSSGYRLKRHPFTDYQCIFLSRQPHLQKNRVSPISTSSRKGCFSASGNQSRKPSKIHKTNGGLQNPNRFVRS